MRNLILVVALLLTACSEKNLINPDKKENPKLSGVFALYEGKALVSTDVLSQEFLLRTRLYTTDHQSGSAQRARRVKFQKGPHGLALMELGEGHSTSKEFTQDNLIAEFENPTQVGNYWVLDLNRAFNKLFLGSDFHENTKEYHKDSHGLVLPFVSSFLSQLAVPQPQTPNPKPRIILKYFPLGLK